MQMLPVIFKLNYCMQNNLKPTNFYVGVPYGNKEGPGLFTTKIGKLCYLILKDLNNSNQGKEKL